MFEVISTPMRASNPGNKYRFSITRLIWFLWPMALSINVSTKAIAEDFNRSKTNLQPRPSILAPFEWSDLDEESTLDSTGFVYTLGPGDRVSIQLLNIQSNTPDNPPQGFLVLADGSINLPLIGSIKVQNLTLDEARDLLIQRYSQYAKYPAVNISLTTPRLLTIVVGGEVYRPGFHKILPVSRDSPNESSRESFLSIPEALQAAGGITSLADIRNIQVRRRIRDREETISINLWDLLQGGETPQNMLLRDGDAIFVPTAKALDPEESQKLGRSSFAPDNIEVYVVGEVVNPGALQLTPNTPLNQAILAAGGFQRSARRSVELVRLNANGTAERRKVRVDFSQDVNEETNPALRNGDAIVVRRTGIASFSATLGDVFGALRDFLIFQSFIPDNN